MRYKIVYDTPGRIRVRCGQYAFFREQGYGIASLLLSQKGVLEAVANPANGSILVVYQSGWQENILRAVASLQKDRLPVGTASDADSVRAIDGRFQRQLAGLCVRRFLVRPLLPMPVRIAMTLSATGAGRLPACTAQKMWQCWTARRSRRDISEPPDRST